MVGSRKISIQHGIVRDRLEGLIAIRFVVCSGNSSHVLCLGTLVRLGDFKLYLLALVQGAVSLTPDRAVVDEDILLCAHESPQAPSTLTGLARELPATVGVAVVEAKGRID